jgi:N-ethylmaleimide reductase
MNLEDIARTVAAFKNSAAMALRAGFDGIQIQGGFIYLFQQFHHGTTNLRTDQFGRSVENRTRFLFEVLDAVLKVWPSERVGIKTGPMMSEQGVFKAIESTLTTHEYIFDRLNSYNLSHVLLMGEPAGRGLHGADISATPLAHLKGEEIFRYFRRRYRGNLILSTGINQSRANQLLEEELGDLIAFGLCGTPCCTLSSLTTQQQFRAVSPLPRPAHCLYQTGRSLPLVIRLMYALPSLFRVAMEKSYATTSTLTEAT